MKTSDHLNNNGLYPMRLQPIVRNYIWGGDRIANEFNIFSKESIIAEAWMLCYGPDGSSIILNGRLKGQSLEDVFGGFGSEPPESGEKVPFMIKLIDAHRDLSIQVHPGDEYALAHEQSFGKTEMWYVLEAEPGSFISLGLRRPVTPEEMKKRMNDGTIIDVIRRVPAHKGDVFFVPAGTIHSIGAGVLIAEIQQNSNVTYRVFDFDREDERGNRRELHIDKALEVMFPIPHLSDMADANERLEQEGYSSEALASCEYFSVHLLRVSTEAELSTGKHQAESLLFLNGSGKIVFDLKFDDCNELSFQKGDSILLPGGIGRYRVIGESVFLRTFK